MKKFILITVVDPGGDIEPIYIRIDRIVSVRPLENTEDGEPRSAVVTTNGTFFRIDESVTSFIDRCNAAGA